MKNNTTAVTTLKTLGCTANGMPIYDATAIGGHSHRPDLDTEAIEKVSFDGGFSRITVDLERIIGVDHCIETTEEDTIVYLRRSNRNGKSRMVLNRTAMETSKVSLILITAGKEDGEFADKSVLWTLFEGEFAPKEPFDNFRSDEERKESEEFWANHALVPTDEELAQILG